MAEGAGELAGVIPIVCTPFDEREEVDTGSLAREVDFLLGCGVHGVGIGFGSEIHRLTDDERDLVVTTVAGRVAGRLPVIAGVGAGSLHAACCRARAAGSAGASVLMVTPPPVTGVTADDLVDYYGAVAEASGLPIMVQDAPGMTGVQMPVPTLVRLARQLDAVVALKIEAQPTAPKLGAVAEALEGTAAALGGAGGLDFYHELERGAAGTIPGPAFAARFVTIWRDYVAGRHSAAFEGLASLLPALTLSSRGTDTFLYVQKELLRRKGVLGSARLRRPCEPFDPRLDHEIAGAVAALAP